VVGDFWSPTVAIKIVDLSQHPEHEDEILTEVVTYNTLKELQGNCIPKLKVAGFDDMLFVIAMQLVGSPLEVEKTNHSERLTIVDKLSLTIFSSIMTAITMGFRSILLTLLLQREPAKNQILQKK